MKTHRRWMKSVLVESTKPGIRLPWQRGNRPSATRSVIPESGAKAFARR